MITRRSGSDVDIVRQDKNHGERAESIGNPQGPAKFADYPLFPPAAYGKFNTYFFF